MGMVWREGGSLAIDVLPGRIRKGEKKRERHDCERVKYAVESQYENMTGDS